jgi:hypothetical protein
MADHERRLNEMPGRLPPGHVERRQVSNEVLAFQIQSLHDTVIANQALLREQMKDGFADVNRRLDKHDELIAGVREEMVRIDARTASLEQHRAEVDMRVAEETRQNVLELATARDGAQNDRITTFITRAAVGSLGVLVAVVGLVQAFGGFK